MTKINWFMMELQSLIYKLDNQAYGLGYRVIHRN